MRLLGPNDDVAVTVDAEATELALERNGTTLLDPIDLAVEGLFGELPRVDWADGGAVEVGDRRVVEESYELPTGKARERHHRAAETTLRYTHPDAAGLVEVDLRVATDGVAFRYRITGEGRDFFYGDHTTVYPPADAMAWLSPLDRCHEGSSSQQPVAEVEGEFNSPGLFTVDDEWCLLAEAGVDGEYAAARLTLEEDTGITFGLPTNLMNARYPVETPWRVAIVGDLADVVESTLVEDLVGEPTVDAPAEPGRVAWSWWAEGESPGDLARQREYVDYAAQRGWEYVLVDAGWERSYDEVPALVEYADERGVGIFLWTHWTDLNAESTREEYFAEWSDWGVAGVKIDFMDGDDQGRMQFYDHVVHTAAAYDLMLNFHGSVVPTGLQRRHPNVMTYEGVYGAEWYKWQTVTPEHNCTLPFTRNVVGPMDYTPVTFSADARHTSAGHELGQSVVFESALQHFADGIDEYAERPAAEAFLERVPAAWEESRLVAGHPGVEATIARRSREDGAWFLGSITAGPPRTVEFAPSFLAGERTAHLVCDAGDDELARETRDVAPEEPVAVEVARNGGFVARFE